MKIFDLNFLERNGHVSGFVKSALCVLEVGVKSSFSISGHACRKLYSITVNQTHE